MVMTKRISKKQQTWLDCYCGVSKMNAADAARRAGYKDPYKSGFENSRKLQKQISQRMHELQERSGTSIMAQQEVAERLSSFANGTMMVKQLANNGKLVDAPVAPKDQLKALELLGKSYGMFVDKKEITGVMDINVGVGDYDDDG